MKDFFRNVVLHNFWLKLISLLLATSLWLALARDPIAEVAVEVPVVFRNIPDDLGMSYERIPQAQIVLRGPERAVRKLQPSDVHAEVDLTGAKPGERTFPSTSVRVHQPHDLNVISVSPERFYVTFVAIGKTQPTSAQAPK
jgi:hypothetical protein